MTAPMTLSVLRRLQPRSSTAAGLMGSVLPSRIRFPVNWYSRALGPSHSMVARKGAKSSCARSFVSSGAFLIFRFVSPSRFMVSCIGPEWMKGRWRARATELDEGLPYLCAQGCFQPTGVHPCVYHAR